VICGDVMNKIEFEVNANIALGTNYFTLRHPNFYSFCTGRKGDKLDRKLHVHDGDRFKVTIQKVKA